MVSGAGRRTCWVVREASSTTISPRAVVSTLSTQATTRMHKAQDASGLEGKGSRGSHCSDRACFCSRALLLVVLLLLFLLLSAAGRDTAGCVRRC